MSKVHGRDREVVGSNPARRRLFLYLLKPCLELGFLSLLTTFPFFHNCTDAREDGCLPGLSLELIRDERPSPEVGVSPVPVVMPRRLFRLRREDMNSNPAFRRVRNSDCSTHRPTKPEIGNRGSTERDLPLDVAGGEPRIPPLTGNRAYEA